MIQTDRPKDFCDSEPVGSGVIPASPRGDIIKDRIDLAARAMKSSLSARQTITTKETKEKVQISSHPMLEELAELISQAWAEYEIKNGPSAANDAIAIVGQGAQQKQPNLKVVRATPPKSTIAPEAAVDKIYDSSTQKMLRRIDALITPFTTDESSALPAATPRVTPDR